jgi:uncharacterized protein (TIGR02145 family)
MWFPKQYDYIAIIIFGIAYYSCKTTNPAHSNNQIASTKIFSDSIAWMTTNLNLNIPGSYCYDNKKENCEHYGRLYTWEAAKQGCSLLGQGWQLPTIEQWQALSLIYRENSKDSIEVRKLAYAALMKNGESNFNALLGGGRDAFGQFARLEAHGFYWTAIENDSIAWFANFAKGSQSLFIQDGGEKVRAFSVRCVRHE